MAAFKYVNLDVDESEDQVFAGRGRVKTIHAGSKDAAALYLKFFDALAADVVVGTTVADWVILVPIAGSIDIPCDLEFVNGLTIAAVTTAPTAGSTGPVDANDLVVSLEYTVRA